LTNTYGKTFVGMQLHAEDTFSLTKKKI
jgi:hypothetical protein